MVNTLLQNKRSLLEILSKGLIFYKQYFLPLTLPLLLPWVSIVLGSFLWVALPILLFNQLKNAEVFPLLFLLIFFIAMLPGMFLFFKGFWYYLIFYSAQNVMVRDILDNGGCDPEIAVLKVQSRSNDFGLMLGFFCILALIPFVLTAIFSLPVALFQIPEPYTSIILGVALFGFSFLLLAVLNYFSLSFQIFVFEPDGFFKVLDKSIRLVKPHYLKCFAVLLVSIIVASALLPWLFSLVFHFSHLMQVLNIPSYWLVDLYFKQLDFTQLPSELGQMKQMTLPISLALTDLMLQSTVTALLLPLGSTWFTFLYGDCKQRELSQ